MTGKLTSKRRLIGIGAGAVVVIAAAVTLTLVFAGTDEAPALPALGRAGSDSPQAKALAEPLGRFGFGLLALQAEVAADENIVISPASIHAAFSMLLNGARDETADELRRALQVDSLDDAAVDQGWADIITSAQAGDGSKLSIADSLWLRSGVAFEQPFLDLNRDYYAAELAELADDGDQAAAEINEWVDERTHGKITKLFDSIDPLTLLTLVNTVYLKVGWDYFDEKDTQPAPFTLADGSTADVEMMRGGMEAPVVLTEAYDAVLLETDGPVDVWVIVPKGSETPETVVAALQDRGLAGLYESAQSHDGDLRLPRLSLEYTAQQLKETLQAMGIERVFDADLAQLEGIADVKPLYVSSIVHKATLDLNEEGVEAAAATGMEVGTTAMPVDTFSIVADRPFLVALAESGSRVPLFLSLVRDPS